LANPQIPSRLLQLDEITRGDHYYITEIDVCLHLWEYVARGRVQEHPTNQLIQNLKIPPSEQTNNPFRWRYKPLAIGYAAQALSQVVPRDFFIHSTWIPIPPSAGKGSPDHDPRLLAILKAVRPAIPDVRELVVQNVHHTAREKGIPPQSRAEDYVIDETLADPPPTHAILFDDVLTSGCHFKSMQIVLQGRFPGIQTAGLFLARTIRPDEPTGDELEGIAALFARWGGRTGI
jgi:hypothetical protein